MLAAEDAASASGSLISGVQAAKQGASGAEIKSGLWDNTRFLSPKPANSPTRASFNGFQEQVMGRVNVDKLFGNNFEPPRFLPAFHTAPKFRRFPVNPGFGAKSRDASFSSRSPLPQYPKIPGVRVSSWSSRALRSGNLKRMTMRRPRKKRPPDGGRLTQTTKQNPLCQLRLELTRGTADGRNDLHAHSSPKPTIVKTAGEGPRFNENVQRSSHTPVYEENRGDLFFLMRRFLVVKFA